LSSERRLIEALLTVAGETAWSRVTVTALCRSAGVHRSTFYGHFESVDDVLVRGLPLWFDAWAGPEGLSRALVHVAEHPRFYTRALSEEPALRRVLETYLDGHLKAAGQADDLRRAMLVGAFLGALGCVAGRADGAD